MSNTQLLEKIDAAIAEKNLLKHPFYQDWQAGKLSRESLQLYAAQYYRHVDAFPNRPAEAFLLHIQFVSSGQHPRKKERSTVISFRGVDEVLGFFRENHFGSGN